MAFIDDHRDRFGVEPICRVLTEHGVKIAPSGYYAFKKRSPSARVLRDAELVVEIERVFWDRNLGRGISGARKVWRLLKREGIDVARCTVERLMRQQGLRGIRRGKQFITTRPDDTAARAPDHVQREFRADRPNELWVVDFTHVPTRSGMAFTAFVTDVFSRMANDEPDADRSTIGRARDGALNPRPRRRGRHRRRSAFGHRVAIHPLTGHFVSQASETSRTARIERRAAGSVWVIFDDFHTGGASDLRLHLRADPLVQDADDHWGSAEDGYEIASIDRAAPMQEIEVPGTRDMPATRRLSVRNYVAPDYPAFGSAALD